MASQKESDEAEILKIGADMNGKDRDELNDGFTPLHLAASFNKSEIVKILTSSGVTVIVKSNNGRTPLDSYKVLKRNLTRS